MNDLIPEIKSRIGTPRSVLEANGIEINKDNKARCLWHTEGDDSLHVYDDHVFCYGCSHRADQIDLWAFFNGKTTVEAIAELAGQLDLPAGVAGKNGAKKRDQGDNITLNRGTAGKPRIVATYDYLDENEELLFQVLRYVPKGFKQRRPNGKGGWIWKVEGVRQVPYLLPALLDAIREGKTVFVPEGEKDVETVALNLGLAATCNPGGKGKWEPEYSEHCRGGDVVILPDNHKPGWDHAEQVARSLKGIAKRVRILELPGLPDKGDVTDWIDAGGTLEEFLRLADLAPEAVAIATKPDAAPIGDVPVFPEYRLSDLENYVPDPSDFVAGRGFLRRGGGTLLTASTGFGKSVLAAEIAVSVAGGIPILGCIRVPQPCGVVYVQAENDQGVLADTFPSVVVHRKADRNLLEQNLSIHHVYGLDGDGLARFLEPIMETRRPGLLGIDPYQAYVGAVEMNSSLSFLAWVRPIERLVRHYGCALLLVCHTTSPQDRSKWNPMESVYSAAGTKTIANWARASCELTAAGQSTERFRLRFGKNAGYTGLVDDDGRTLRDLYIEQSGNPHKPYWRVGEDQSAPGKSEYRDKVIALATSHPSMSYREIARELECGKSTVEKYYPVSK